MTGCARTDYLRCGRCGALPDTLDHDRRPGCRSRRRRRERGYRHRDERTATRNDQSERTGAAVLATVLAGCGQQTSSTNTNTNTTRSPHRAPRRAAPVRSLRAKPRRRPGPPAGAAPVPAGRANVVSPTPPPQPRSCSRNPLPGPATRSARASTHARIRAAPPARSTRPSPRPTSARRSAKRAGPTRYGRQRASPSQRKPRA